VTPYHRTTNTSLAVWVALTAAPTGEVVASCQRVDSCHSTVVRLAHGCQFGWRVSVGASSRAEESPQLQRLAPGGWGRSSLEAGGQPIEAQPGAEFGVGVAELVGRESSIEIRTRDWAARLVLGQSIGPPRPLLLHLLNRHPDDNLMRKVLSPHGQTLPK